MLRVIVAFAGLLFLTSVFFPFLSAENLNGSSAYLSVTSEHQYLSFKETVVDVYRGWGLVIHTNRFDYWFDSYWSYVGWAGFDPLLLVTLFEVQVLTVMCAGFAAFKPGPLTVLLPTVFSIFTVYSMLLFSHAELRSSMHLTGLQMGFWLALASALLFLLIFFVSWKWIQKSYLFRDFG